MNIINRICCLFSEKARAEYEREKINSLLAEGRHLWQQLNDKLPKAYGRNQKDDEPRMRAFRNLISAYTMRQKSALISWLKHEIAEMDNNWCEITSGEHERYERCQLQILCEHLRILQS